MPEPDKNLEQWTPGKLRIIHYQERHGESTKKGTSIHKGKKRLPREKIVALCSAIKES